MSNVLCSGRYCIKKVHDKEDLIPELIKISVQDSYAIKMEALYCLTNLCARSGVMMTQKLLQMGIMGPIIHAMGVENQNEKLLLFILKGLKNIFH